MMYFRSVAFVACMATACFGHKATTAPCPTPSPKPIAKAKPKHSSWVRTNPATERDFVFHEDDACQSTKNLFLIHPSHPLYPAGGCVSNGYVNYGDNSGGGANTICRAGTGTDRALCKAVCSAEPSCAGFGIGTVNGVDLCFFREAPITRVAQDGGRCYQRTAKLKEPKYNFDVFSDDGCASSGNLFLIDPSSPLYPAGGCKSAQGSVNYGDNSGGGANTICRAGTGTDPALCEAVCSAEPSCTGFGISSGHGVDLCFFRTGELSRSSVLDSVCYERKVPTVNPEEDDSSASGPCGSNE